MTASLHTKLSSARSGVPEESEIVQLRKRADHPKRTNSSEIYEEPAEVINDAEQIYDSCASSSEALQGQPRFSIPISYPKSSEPFSYTRGCYPPDQERRPSPKMESAPRRTMSENDHAPIIYERTLSEYSRPSTLPPRSIPSPVVYAEPSYRLERHRSHAYQTHAYRERSEHAYKARPPSAVSVAAVEHSKITPGSLLVLHRTRRFNYDHWVVYVGNGRIVHLVGAEELETREQSLKMFFKSLFGDEEYFGVHLHRLDEILGKSELSIGDAFEEHSFLGQPFPRQTIVERALSLVGQRGYDPIFNNSEQLATWARYGKSFSEQSGQWSRPLPVGSMISEMRLRIDELSAPHRRTERFDWIGLLTNPATLQRYKFLGSFSGVKSMRDTGMRLKSTYEDATCAGNRDSAARFIDFVAAGTTGWLAIQRKTGNKSTLPSSSWKLRAFQEPELEENVLAVKEYHAKILSEGRAIRQITASGNTIVVVTGPLLAGEAVTLCATDNVGNMAAFAEKSWRKSSPRYIYTSAYFNGFFLAVASNSVRLEDQTVFWAAKFPTATVRSHLDQGYIVSGVVAGPVWIVFMDKSKYSSSARQVMFTVPSGGKLPAKELRKYWQSGLILTVAAGN